MFGVTCTWSNFLLFSPNHTVEDLRGCLLCKKSRGGIDTKENAIPILIQIVVTYSPVLPGPLWTWTCVETPCTWCCHLPDLPNTSVLAHRQGWLSTAEWIKTGKEQRTYFVGIQIIKKKEWCCLEPQEAVGSFLSFFPHVSGIFPKIPGTVLYCQLHFIFKINL